MGNQFSSADVPHTVAAPVGSTPDEPKAVGQSGIYRSNVSPGTLISTFPDFEIRNAYDTFLRSLSFHPHANHLGSRIMTDPANPGDFRYITYTESERIINDYVNALYPLVKQRSYVDETYGPAVSLKPVGICSRNRYQWFLTDLAAQKVGLTSVPLYETLGTEGMRHMIRQTQLSVVCASEKNAMNLLKILDEETAATLETIVIFDRISTDVMDNSLPYSDFVFSMDEEISNEKQLMLLAQEKNVNVVSFYSLCSEGAKMTSQGHKISFTAPTLEDVMTICYTSGTTGVPKGAMLTHRNLVSVLAAGVNGPLKDQGTVITNADVYFSYLPLAHVLERTLCYLITSFGGALACYRGDAPGLLDDLRVARPTCFASVPRLFMKIHDTLMAKIKEASPVLRYLFNHALEAKLTNFKTNGRLDHAVYDKIIFKKVKELMGGRLRVMVVGGAALEKRIQEELSVIFGAPMLEGYGMTEAFGSNVIRRGDDSIYGHIGMNLPNNEISLLSVPDMGYQIDKTGEAAPGLESGELLIRGHSVMAGYFRNPEETAKAIDSNGWLHTGDIVARMEEGGRLRVVDRRKDIFKMSQGEYVSPAHIENIMLGVPLIAQCVVYGNSTTRYLTGGIYLDFAEVVKMAVKGKFGGRLFESRSEMMEYFSSESGMQILKPIVFAELKLAYDAASINSFERIKNFFLMEEEMTVENGLMTPTFKLKRNEFNKKYATQLAAISQ